MNATTSFINPNQAPQHRLQFFHVITICCLFFSTGCGALAQSIVGWSDEVRTPYEIQRTIEVRSSDPSHRIYRVGDDGQLTDLGTGSVQEVATIKKEHIKQENKYVASMIGSIATTAIGALFVARGIQSDRNFHASYGETNTASLTMYMNGAIILGIAFAELVGVPIAQALSSGKLTERTLGSGHVRTYLIKDGTREMEQRVDAEVTQRLTVFADGRPTAFEARTTGE